jgi:hypothetical protein
MAIHIFDILEIIWQEKYFKKGSKISQNSRGGLDQK